MAKSTPLEKLNKKYGVSNKKSSSLEGIDKVKKTVSNYQTRLKEAGIEDTVEDTRNPLEKALNLEKDQNVLFDILELINRPQNALLTGINNALSGESFGEGLKEGITGETKTSGKDILTDQLDMKDEAGKLDLSDVLGFGIDVISDPLDWALIPATGGLSKAADVASETAKIANAAGEAADTIKAVDTARDALRVAKNVGKASEISKAKTALNEAKDLAKAAKKADVTRSLFYNAGKSTTSLNNMLGKGIGKAIKGTGKLADNAIEGTLNALDNKNAKKINKFLDKNEGLTELDAIKQLGINPDKLGLYKNMKKQVGNALDSAKNVGGFVGRSRSYDEAKDFDRMMGKAKANQIKELIDVTASDVYDRDELSKRLVNAIQSEKDWSLTGQDIINRFVEGKGRAYVPSDEQANEIMRVLDQFGIKAKKVSKSIDNVDEALDILKKQGINATKEELLEDLGTELIIDDKNKNALITIRDALFDPKTRNVTNDLGVDNLTKFTDLNFGSRNSKRINKQLLDDRTFFEQTPELQNLYNKASNAVKDYATDVSSISEGLNAGEAATRGYVKASRTSDLKRSPTKEFESVEENLKSSIAQNNAYKRQEQLREIVNKTNQNRKLERDIYKVNEKTGELVRDKSGNLVRDDVKYNEYVRKLQNSVNNTKKNIEEIKSIQKLTKEGILEEVPNMSKVRQKQIDNIMKEAGLQEDLSKLEANLGNITEITPEMDTYIDKLKDATDSFLKDAKGKKSLVKNPEKALTKYADDAEEFLGNIKNTTDAVNKDFKTLNVSAKRLKTAINETNTAFSKEVKVANKEIKKAYKDGLELGKKRLKASQALKDNTKAIELAKETNADMLDSLQKKLNLNEQKVLQSKTSDEMFNYIQGKIAKNVEDIEILKSDVAQSFFKERFEDTFVDYVQGAVKQNAGTKKWYDALASGIFNLDGEYVKTYSKGQDIPYGFTKINGHTLSKKFDYYKSIMSDDGKALGYIIDDLKGKDLLVDSQLLKALDMGSGSYQSVSPLLKFFDNVNNKFKKFSTLSPGFLTRNITGNGVNIYLSGANMAEMPKYYAEATGIMKNAKSLFNKATEGALAGKELEQFNNLKKFYSAGFAEAITKGYGMEAIKEATKGPFNKVSKAVLKINNDTDGLNRMALLLYAEKHPEYVRKLGKSSAIDAVKHVLFDPSNLSEGEQVVAKRLIPFYTFTKQNLLFQANNIMKNTSKYSKLYKSLRDAYNDLDEDSYYEYQRNGMQIPLPFTDDEGNQLFYKANLPLSDLGEFLSNPIKKGAASLTPVLKAPIEMTTGKSLYTGEDTNYNVLKNKLNDLGVSSKGIQNTAQAAETILNNFGLQNVSTNLVRKVQAIIDGYNGDIAPQQVWAEIFRSVVQNANQENVETSKLYDEMEGYQQLFSELKKQGIDVPTIREINASNKNKLRNMKNKRTKSK